MAPDIIAAGVATKTTTLSKQPSISSCAYVTFFAGNGDYIKGVVGLAKGLRKAKSQRPLVVAILPDVPEEHRKILVSQGCIVREIEPVHAPENQTQFSMADYVINYSKLRIWEFVEYSKMVYVDRHIQVFDNIDHLFDMEAGYFYGVMDCFCEKTCSHSPQYKIGYCQRYPDRVKWPDEMGPEPPLYFNAGMFVFEPSITTYNLLMDTLKVPPPTPFAEQDFLNMSFRNILDVYIHRRQIILENLLLSMSFMKKTNSNQDKQELVFLILSKSQLFEENTHNPFKESTATVVFSKVLKQTDTKARLAIPTHSLKDLPSFNGSHYKLFKVKHESSKKPLEFRLSKRKKGDYAKPVFTGDWIKFVKCKQLEIGDKVTLIKEDGQGSDALYTIQVMKKKKFRLFGQNIIFY